MNHSQSWVVYSCFTHITCFFLIAHIGDPFGKCCEGYKSSFNQLKGRRIVFGNDWNMCHAWKMLEDVEDLKELGC